MLWNTSLLLLLASADYAMGSHGRHHAHRHRARNYIKPVVDMMEPRNLAGADAPLPIKVHTKVQTIIKTVFEKCVPTNTGLTTKVLDSFVPEPTQSKPPKPEPVMPAPTHSQNTNTGLTTKILDSFTPEPTQSKPPKPEPVIPEPMMPEPTHSHNTNTGLTTKILDSFTPEPTQSKPPKPEPVMPAPTHSQNTKAPPTHSEIKEPQPTASDEITTIHIRKTKTVTTTVTATAPAVKVSPDVTATSSTGTSVEGQPIPDATKTDNAPNIIPTLENLPGQLPGDLMQILPGEATVVPVPQLPNLGQVLYPGGQAVPSNLDWTAVPKGHFSAKGFGGQSSSSGSEIHYKGNVGKPWGSNIISVSPAEAHRYKYVAKFTGSNTKPWTVTIWNKVGPDDKIDGWYGHSALTFVLKPGETHYVAFDEDSEGAWGAAPGTKGLPKDSWGGYTSTWGEFSFGDGENSGWSGWDVSAIQAQLAHHYVQGMRICMADGRGCSSITPQAKKVVDAYTESKRHHDGIGGAASPGPVRLVVDIDYQG